MKPQTIILLYFAFVVSICSNAVESKIDTTRQRAALKRASNIKTRPFDSSRNIHELDTSSLNSKLVCPEPLIRVRGGQFTNSLSNAFLGSIVMALIEKIAKEGLQKSGIKFPAGLGACILLFTILIMLDFVTPATSTYIFQSLVPGSALLAKWLPVMFVPGLVMLPLSPPIGSTVDVSDELF
jgi:hypothetical protein